MAFCDTSKQIQSLWKVSREIYDRTSKWVKFRFTGRYDHNIVNFSEIITFSRQIVFASSICCFLACPSLRHWREREICFSEMLCSFWTTWNYNPEKHTYICICFRLLQSEFERHKSTRNTDTAMKLHDVGVTLFYHIITLYNDESAFYPPSKQLLTTYIESLGQVSTVKSCFSVPTFMKSHI